MFESFLKRRQLKKEEKTEENHASKFDSHGIHIQIDGDINLFKAEKEKIIEGAMQLLQIGKADNLEDAIITFAVMFRGLKFSEIRKTEDGKTIVVLRETAQGKVKNVADVDEFMDR